MAPTIIERNLNNWTEPEWHVPSSARSEEKLARAFLSHFQLGESGGGNFLSRRPGTGAGDALIIEALELFIAEDRRMPVCSSSWCIDLAADTIDGIGRTPLSARPPRALV